MSGKITFVGAGPGAPDLITLRGAAALDEAGCIVYAGSLVDERLLDRAPGARLVNSAKLSLEEVLAILEAEYRAGKKVVRLHSGDPAMYGAVSEQYRELEKRGIAFDVVPGVSSVFAAAAELQVELTMPEVSQSVILTRMEGRTPVPERESLEHLARCGSTICIYLSVADMHALCEKLLAAGRPPETPAAVVYRASWPNQVIVRGAISDIAAKVEAAGIKRQSMIVIGDVLRRDGELSRLYDESFSTGYRKQVGEQRFCGRVAVFALTARGASKAAEIASGLEDATILLPEKHAHLAPRSKLACYPDGGFADAFVSSWKRFDGFVMVMAAGIVVRQAGKLCESKLHDPAVVVCDEAGDYAVSLLSGHLGGANRLAAEVAGVTGGKAVLTTASDVRQLMAFDELAARFHYRIVNPEALTAVAAAVLDGEKAELEMPPELFQYGYADLPQFSLAGSCPDGGIRVRVPGRKLELRLKKRRYALGIGCRRGVPASEIGCAVEMALLKHQLHIGDVFRIGTASLKRDEAGLLEYAGSLKTDIKFFETNELNGVDVPNPSDAAEAHLGVKSVSEAAALLAAGPGARLVVEKIADKSVTVAVAEEP